jgi:hypothetical protein
MDGQGKPPNTLKGKRGRERRFQQAIPLVDLESEILSFLPQSYVCSVFMWFAYTYFKNVRNLESKWR